MKFVIDASALLDAADIDHPEWAISLLGAHRSGGLQAPAILASEVGQVVHRKRPLEFGPTLAARADAVDLLLAQAELSLSDAAHRAASARVAESGLTFYDAEYVALAHRDDCVLVTHDSAMTRIGLKVLGRQRVVDLDGLRRLVSSAAA